MYVIKPVVENFVSVLCCCNCIVFLRIFWMMHIVHLFSTSSYQKLSCIYVFSSSSNDVIFFSDGGYVNISLENYNTSSIAGHLIKDVKQILPLSTIILNVIRIPETVRFIVVQAHTFQYNVTLSYDAILSPHSFINGTNLGLVQLISKSQSNATFYIQNTNARPSITVLITVQGYGEEGKSSCCSWYCVGCVIIKQCV